MASEEFVGRVIHNKWKIVRKIGQGGMGTVWEVYNERVGLRRAIKQIKTSLSDNREVVRRFQREVRLMAMIDGADNIVRVHDLDDEAGFGVFLLMDLIDGPSLAELKGKLSYEEVLHYVRQVAGALRLVHQQGIVHRDIKAPNVLIDVKRRKAYLTDFGIAKELSVEGEQTVDATGTILTDQFVGTPRYACPEQLKVEYPPKPVWDLYAMGALLYEVYSGLQFLPHLRSHPDFVSKIGYDPHYRVELKYPIPPPPLFGQLIERCVERDPALRLQTADELLQLLEECAAQRADMPSGLVAPERRRVSEDTTIVDPLDEPRRALRDEVERGMGRLGEIEEMLVALGMNLPAGPATDTLGGALHDISQFEGEREYPKALGHLERLRDQVDEAQQRGTEALRAFALERLEVLDEQRRGLERRAGPWLDPAALAAVDAGLEAVRRAVDASSWRELAAALASAAEPLAASAAAARDAATAAVEALVNEATSAAAELAALGAAPPADYREASLRTELAAHLEDGELVEARQRAEAVRDALAAAVAAARAAAVQRERELVAARQRLQDAQAALDALLVGLDAAAVAAAPQAAAVARERAAAASAEADGDLVEAEAALSRATAAAEALAAEIVAAAQREREAAAARAAAEQRAREAAEARARAEAEQGERAALNDTLRAALAAAADWPAPLAGAARAAAEQLVADVPAAHDTAVAAMQEAIATLERVGSEAPAYAAAAAAVERAAAGRAAAADLPLPARDRRRVEELHQEAEGAFAARRWEVATRDADAVAGQWQEWVAQAQARSERERCAALRAAAATALEPLAVLAEAAATLGVAVQGLDVAALRADFAAAAGREEAGDLATAAIAFEALRARGGALATAQRQALDAGAAAAAEALTARWRGVAEAAGELVGAADASAVERHLAAIGAARTAGDWAQVARSAAAAEGWVAERAAGLTQEARVAVDAALAEIAAARDGLRDGGEGEGDATRLTAEVEALLERGGLGAAVAAANAARAAIGERLAAQRAADTARATTAREQLTAALQGVDGAAAARVAAAAWAEVTRQRAAADAALTGGNARAAAAAYGAAHEALATVVAALAAEVQARLESLADGLRELLDGAATQPATLVEAARAAARAALAEWQAAAPAAAEATLRAARDGLSAALAEAPAFAAAAAARSAATAELEKLQTSTAPAAAREAGEKLVRAGEAAFTGRDWTAAGRQFDAAHAAAAAALQAEARRQAEARERAAKRQTALAAIQPLIARAAKAPEALVGAVLAIARTRAADAESTAAALEEAAQQLAAELAEQPRYRTAEERRSAALARAKALADRPARRTLRRAASDKQAEAERAFGERHWEPAAQLFAAAMTAWDEVERTPPAPTPWLLIGGVGATALAAAGAGIWWQTRPHEEVASRPSPVVRATAVATLRPATAVPKAEATLVAPPVAPPQPPVQVARPHIAATSPPQGPLTVRENEAQRFAVELAGGGDAAPAIEWLFKDKPVAAAAGKREWELTPGYDAAGGPYDVAVRVGAGTAADEQGRWQVTVTDVNRSPLKVSANPNPDKPVVATVDDKARFQLKASDPDSDALKYAWTLDGKPVGTGQDAVEVPITDTNEHRLALAVSDGKGGTLAEDWRITPQEGKLVLQPQPASAALRFGEKKAFTLAAKKPVDGLQIAWAVNGDKRTDAPSFTFNADDPALVGTTVKITATARDARGRSYDYAWNVPVQKPAAPTLNGSPTTRVVEGAPGTPQSFSVTASGGVDGQQLGAPTFTVNGQPQPADGNKLTFTPQDEGTYAIVASVRDNFGQVVPRDWTFKVVGAAPPPPADIDAAVESWLKQYQAALNSQDAAAVGRLLGLSAAQLEKLKTSWEAQKNLKVEFSGVSIKPSGGGQATASYTRTDSFTDPTSKARSQSVPVSQTFGLENGRAVLKK